MHKVGFDDNLGLPDNFVRDIPCQLVSYHDLAELIDAFLNGNLSAVFIPAGSLPYVDSSYQILAQATLGQNRDVHLSAVFSSLNEITMETIADKKIGKINRYCTTSYWAPMIYLMNKLPPKTKLTFGDANSFEDLLEKTASGVLACSMIWDKVLQKHPDAAKKLHSLFQMDDLPTPIILGKPNLPDTLVKGLQNFHTNDKKVYFNGFTRPDMQNLEKFKQAMLAAQAYFGERNS